MKKLLVVSQVVTLLSLTAGVVNAQLTIPNPVNVPTVDIGYLISGGTDDLVVKTCTISGTTVTCGDQTTALNVVIESVSLARTPSAGRIWVAAGGRVYEANQTGDATSSTTWTARHGTVPTSPDEDDVTPYGVSDKILVISDHNPGGTKSDGLQYTTCTSGRSCNNYSTFVSIASPDQSFVGAGFRISDTDFRFSYKDANFDVFEAKFDGSSTWTATYATIFAGTSTDDPNLFYDRIGDQAYALYTELDGTPRGVWYHLKTCVSGSGCSEGSWGAQTDADNDESDGNVTPITQMHEPPTGSSRTTPREFTWCYKNDNSSNWDVVCGNLNLAAGGPTLEQTMRHGKWLVDGVENAFTF